MKDLTYRIIKKIILILLLILIASFYVAETIEISKLTRVLLDAEIMWIILALLFFYISLIIRALRWRIFLQGNGISISKRRTFEVYSNGQYLNLFLPLKLGDVYRAFITNPRSESNTSRIMGTIVSERLIDLSIISVSLVIFTPLALRSGSKIRDVLIWSSSIILILILILLVVYFLSKNPDIIPYLNDIQDELLSGINSVWTSIKNHWIKIPGLSLSIWLTNVIRLVFVLEALNATINIYGVFFVALLLALASGIPYIPSGIGVFEILGSHALITLGLTPSTAFAIIVIERGINTISFAIVGTIVYIYTRVYQDRTADIDSLVEYAKEIRN